MNESTNPTLGRLLVVDDELPLLHALCDRLAKQGYEIKSFSSPNEALGALEAESFDLLLSDLMMPQMDGIQLIRSALLIDPHLVPIIMTGQGTIPTAVEAMKAGAFDYILKPFKLQSVLPVLARALHVRRLRVENLQLREMMTIYELSQAIAYQLDVNTLLSRLATGALEVLGADEVSVLLPTDDNKEFYVAAVCGEGREHLLGQRIAADRGITGWVVRHREPLVLNGPVTDAELAPQLPRPEIISAISHPLIAGGKLVGLLNINLLKRRQPFTLGQVKGLGILAATASAGLQAASLLAEVRRAEANYRRIVETSAQGVWVINPQGETTFANHRFAAMLGYDIKEVLGRPAADCVEESDRAVSIAALARRPQVPEEEFELRLRRKDGVILWTMVTAAALTDEAGRFASTLRMVTDVSQRRQLEEQLRQSQKMDAIGKLAAGVAHDFNNLLTIINGYSDMLLQSSALDDSSRELITEIKTAGERSAGLTRQLLAFSRQQVLAPRVLDINAIVVDAEKFLRRILGEDIQLTTVLAPGLWNVRADPGQLEQVLLNLAVNARDAMPTGGKLTIETTNVELDESYARTHLDARSGAHVQLSVSDTGCGMSDEVKARLFEPFFTTKDPGKGTGLGLATVYGIVKQSGGHLGVYSEVGRGTSFKVYLPREERPGAAKPSSGLRRPPRGTETVLLVEDEDGVRALTRHVLRNCGYTVLEATDGEGAIRVAEQHSGAIQLVITDVVMPGMGGRELIERLGQKFRGLKVLFISGYTDDAVVRHGILHEKVNFLQKPYSPSALAFKVREVLDGAG